MVYNLIEQIKYNLNNNRVEACPAVDDVDIAFWIRGIISGKSIVQNGALVCCDNISVLAINQFEKLTEKMIAKLIKITYLLFGSEVMRNPASLIHHQMIIDLIIMGYLVKKYSYSYLYSLVRTDKLDS